MKVRQARGGFPAVVGIVSLLVIPVLAFVGYNAVRAEDKMVLTQQSLAKPESFPDLGGRFEPVAAVAPPLSKEEAYQAYLDEPVPPGLDKEASGPPIAKLVLYSNEFKGPKVPTLAWLLLFEDVPVVEFGPDVGKEERKASGEVHRCPVRVVIDATTGQRLSSFQTCDSPNG